MRPCPVRHGYGLGFLGAALMLVAAAEAVSPESRWPRRWIVVYGVGGVIGIWTLPVMVLPFLAGAAVMFVAPRHRCRVGLMVIIVGVASAIVYGAVLDDVVRSSSQQFGEQLSWHAALTVMVEHLVGSEARLVAPGAASWQVVVAFWVLVLAGSAWLRRRGLRSVLAIVWAPYVLTAVALTVSRVDVEPRFLSYLLLNVLLLVVAGVAFGLEAVQAVSVGRVVVAVLVLFALLVGLFNFERFRRWSIAVPIENYKAVAAIVDGAGIECVVVNSRVHVGFQEYFGPERVTFPPPDQLHEAVCMAPGAVAYVVYRYDADAVVLACLAEGDVTPIDVVQQNGWPGGWMQVWLVTARSTTG